MIRAKRILDVAIPIELRNSLLVKYIAQIRKALLKICIFRF